MSPSPHWCKPEETPLGQALAAAQHDAWLVPEDRRPTFFVERFRQLVGPSRAEPLLSAAIAVFSAQAVAPAGWTEPPYNAYWRACPRCQQLKGTPHTIPQNGRLELQVLRDPQWLGTQFDRGRSLLAIAKQLRCAPALVDYWAEKHGLLSPRQERREDIEATVRAMHAQKRGPGAIARELGTQVHHVRQALKRLGLANQKTGQVFHEAEWWRERLVRQSWTLRECAREAGIKPHNATYYVNKFGLSDVTRARAAKKGGSKWRPKYPQLADAATLRQLLAEHGTYEAVARAVGCPHATLVAAWAKKLLGLPSRHQNAPAHAARTWWTERLERGLTTWQLAEEAGISEKSAREKLRVLGAELLAHGYRNNTQAEKARRAERRREVAVA